MDVPEGHLLDVDPRAFLAGVPSQIMKKLEIQAIRGVKFLQALKIFKRMVM